MQTIRNTHIDLKGGRCHEHAPYPLLIHFNASSRPDEENQVTFSCIDFIFALLQHSAVFCMSGKNFTTCKVGGLADL